ncbi:MAG: (Fe-S)-binding protein [Candidatus Thermoplasmatota archaeon]|jgi:Fe-S oxidoreductase|nr:(Fe-S)-binding protein [Candidatus Thermoplasmatota archaeon]MCL5789606.1 (Fe-S)-binding protein [Candidatus Thermoplasmatota archaeon]
MKPKIRDIILESPSGKAEEWLSKQKDIEWAVSSAERRAKDQQLEGIKVDKKGDEAYFLERFKDLKKNRAFVTFMESCTRCGECIDKCQMFIATGDINNSPVGRANLVRKLYKICDDATPKDVDLNKLYSYYYQCTECRRCSVFCPAGIDQAEITRNIRNILTDMGIISEYVTATMTQVYKTGNNMGLKEKFIKNVVSFVEDEMLSESGKKIEIPLNLPKADVLMIPSSADIFVNNDTLKGYAKVLQTLKKEWTISTNTTEAANFGTFASERHLRDFGDMVVSEAVKTGVKMVVWGECGHGWRTANNYVRYELSKRGIELRHIHQITAKAIERKQIHVDRNKNDDLFNYHDPCNLARGGNLVNEPRDVLKAVVRETVEAKYNREKTLCCGAGGGLLADEKEWNEYRAWSGWPAVYFSWRTGAEHMVSPCAIDKAQMPYVMDYHKVKMQNHGLMDLVGYAMEL